MTFTKEQLEKLKEAEPHFKTAKNGYVRFASRALHNLVADTYFEATGQKIPANWSCSICVLNLYRKVGYFYFKDLEELEKQTSSEPEPLPLEDTESNSPEKPVANKNKKKDGSRQTK